MFNSSLVMRDIRLAGCRARLHESGDGPPLLLLPSMLVLARSYVPAVEQLRPHFHVKVLEMPGTGAADPVSEPWSFGEYARWLVRFLRRHCPNPVILVGHSNSGAVAAMAAASGSPRIRALVLVDTVGVLAPRPFTPLLLSRALDALHEWDLTWQAWHHLAHNALRHTRNFFRQVELSGRASILPAAGRIRIPTLLAWGARDHTVPHSCARHLAKAIRGAQVHISRGGSHDWLITHAVEFTQVVREFTGGHTLRRQAPPHRPQPGLAERLTPAPERIDEPPLPSDQRWSAPSPGTRWPPTDELA